MGHDAAVFAAGEDERGSVVAKDDAMRGSCHWLRIRSKKDDGFCRPPTRSATHRKKTLELIIGDWEPPADFLV
jgi:hypothetical protein